MFVHKQCARREMMRRRKKVQKLEKSGFEKTANQPVYKGVQHVRERIEAGWKLPDLFEKEFLAQRQFSKLMLINEKLRNEFLNPFMLDVA